MAPVCNHFSGRVSFSAGYQSPSYYLLMIGTPNLQVLLHPPKLTSPLKRVHFKRISKGRSFSFFFRGHASFQGSKSPAASLHHGPPHPAVLEAVTNPMVYQSLKNGGPSFPLHGFNCSLHGSLLGRFTTSSRNFSSHTPYSHNSLG